MYILDKGGCMKEFIKLFQKVGGKEILRQYAQGHVLIYSLLVTLLMGIDKKSLEIVRMAVNNKRLKKLRKKYQSFIENFMKVDTVENIDIQPRKVWICWFQGMENAPDIVQKCYKSVQANVTDREIVLITENNYKDYVTFPEYIQEKIDAGIISQTHMSDILRLELLLRYGGTWMDATILCTGKIPEYMLDSDLFLFQNLKPGLNGHCTSISNWFITSLQDNKILKLTLALLYEYWKNNDKLLDYFIFHDFFQLAIEVYPEEWSKVIPSSNSTPHILLLRLFNVYYEKAWNAIREQTSIHKLTYKFNVERTKLEDTYYKMLFG